LVNSFYFTCIIETAQNLNIFSDSGYMYIFNYSKWPLIESKPRKCHKI